MAKYKYGIKEFWLRDIDPTDGSGLAAGEIDIKSEVYRDTFDMTEEDGTSTEHYTEMENTPFLSFEEPGKETLSFELVNTTPERLALILGGAVVTTGGKKIWSKPDNQGENEKHVTIVTQDDTEIVIPRAKMVGKKNFTFRRNAPWTLPVTLTPLQPEFESLSPMTISEPE
ncbi:hypothetical protein Q4603_05685 [Zobellia galactanivorans]|uniref:hypothetical protein n=1 Tax=Zobellia galactanivorans (strain DSM 12802 / CCUG 47099 / CIP 106680 / NCIMB 13871 / Dsij) TaxID=63186 RepID=UPI0026E384E6|nr:hypothetical protein [Zobellia galactanivorans]MDO6808086.1 hypothetical protein [Zobellia galactanivorans]